MHGVVQIAVTAHEVLIGVADDLSVLTSAGTCKVERRGNVAAGQHHTSQVRVGDALWGATGTSDVVAATTDCLPAVPAGADVAQTFANTLLLLWALEDLVFKYPHLAQRQQLRASSSSLMLAFNEDPGSSSGCQLLGKGVRCKRVNKQLLMDKVRSFVRRNADTAAGWTEQQVVAAFQQSSRGTGVYLYQRCDLSGFEQVSTASHRPKSSRQNCHVLLEHQGVIDRVGRVVRLLWVRHPDNSSWQGQQADPTAQQQAELDRDLRLALIDLFEKPVDEGGLMRIANKNRVAAAVVFPVSKIQGKLVKFEPAAAGDTEVFFAAYSNMSKSR